MLRCCCLLFFLGVVVGYVLAKWEAEQSYWHRVSAVVYSVFQFRHRGQVQFLDAQPASAPMLAAGWQLAQKALGV